MYHATICGTTFIMEKHHYHHILIIEHLIFPCCEVGCFISIMTFIQAPAFSILLGEARYTHIFLRCLLPSSARSATGWSRRPGNSLLSLTSVFSLAYPHVQTISIYLSFTSFIKLKKDKVLCTKMLVTKWHCSAVHLGSESHRHHRSFHCSRQGFGTPPGSSLQLLL